MTSRSSRGNRKRVLAARRQARIAQGRDPGAADLFTTPQAAKMAAPPAPSAPIAPTLRPSEAIGVLSLGEAAARLGMGRAQLEAMIDAGKVEALPTGYTRIRGALSWMAMLCSS